MSENSLFEDLDKHAYFEETTPKSVKPLPKIFCLIPALPFELKLECLKSVFNQTIPVNHIYILTQKMHLKSPPECVSAVLRQGLSAIDLKKFDYVLRIDADTILPPNFAESALKLDVDVVGGAGYAMLFKVSTFLKVCNGTFHPESDDAYLFHSFKAAGCKVAQLHMPVQIGQIGAKYSQVSYWMNDGKLNFMIGYMPHQVLAHLRLSDLKSFLQAAGYFKALFTVHKPFPFAKQNRLRFLKEKWLARYLSKTAYSTRKMMVKIFE